MDCCYIATFHGGSKTCLHVCGISRGADQCGLKVISRSCQQHLHNEDPFAHPIKNCSLKRSICSHLFAFPTLSVCVCLPLSVCLSVYLSIHLSIHRSVYLFYLDLDLDLYLSLYSVYLCISLFLYFSIYLSIYPSIYLSFPCLGGTSQQPGTGFDGMERVGLKVVHDLMRSMRGCPHTPGASCGHLS